MLASRGELFQPSHELWLASRGGPFQLSPLLLLPSPFFCHTFLSSVTALCESCRTFLSSCQLSPVLRRPLFSSQQPPWLFWLPALCASSVQQPWHFALQLWLEQPYPCAHTSLSRPSPCA